jgi:hypothetical protein
VRLDAVRIYQRKILNSQPRKTHCEPGTKPSESNYANVSLSEFTLTGTSECADVTIDRIGFRLARVLLSGQERNSERAYLERHRLKSASG